MDSPEESRNLVGEDTLVEVRTVVEVDSHPGLRRIADPERMTSLDAFQQVRLSVGGEQLAAVRRGNESEQNGSSKEIAGYRCGKSMYGCRFVPNDLDQLGLGHDSAGYETLRLLILQFVKVR